MVPGINYLLIYCGSEDYRLFLKLTILTADLDFVAVLAGNCNYVNYLLCIYLLNTKCLVLNVICYITQDFRRRLAA